MFQSPLALGALIHLWKHGGSAEASLAAAAKILWSDSVSQKESRILQTSANSLMFYPGKSPQHFYRVSSKPKPANVTSDTVKVTRSWSVGGVTATNKSHFFSLRCQNCWHIFFFDIVTDLTVVGLFLGLQVLALSSCHLLLKRFWMRRSK